MSGSSCWEKCQCCDDYICNIHYVHVFECECDGIDWWMCNDVNPYLNTVDEYNDKGLKPTGTILDD